MKRSLQVSAPLLAAAALAVATAGCRKPQPQRCVDEKNEVVPDSFCSNQHGQIPNPNGSGYIPMYRYYYGGYGGFSPGTVVSGGGYAPITGTSYSTSTTRGGFGSSGDSSGSHGSSGSGGE